MVTSVNPTLHSLPLHPNVVVQTSMFIRTHRKLLTGVAFLSFMTAHSSATFSQRTRSSLPANPEQIVPSSVLAQIKQQAATTYPTDFVMQEYKDRTANLCVYHCSELGTE